jgi:hypothetical protein
MANIMLFLEGRGRLILDLLGGRACECVSSSDEAAANLFAVSTGISETIHMSGPELDLCEISKHRQ